MLPMPVMQPMLQPEPISVQVNLQQELSGEYPPGTESENQNLTQSEEDLKCDEAHQDHEDLSEGIPLPDPSDTDPSAPLSSETPLQSLSTDQAAFALDRTCQQSIRNEVTVEEDTQEGVKEKAESEVPVIVLGDDPITFELPDQPGSIIEIEEDGKIQHLSVEEGLTTLALGEKAVTVRLLDEQGNVLQIWKSEPSSLDSTQNATKPSLSPEQSSNSGTALKPDQSTPVFVNKPKPVSKPQSNPSVVAVQNVSNALKPANSSSKFQLSEDRISSSQNLNPAAPAIQAPLIQAPDVDLSKVNDAIQAADPQPILDALDFTGTAPVTSSLIASAAQEQPALSVQSPAPIQAPASLAAVDAPSVTDTRPNLANTSLADQFTPTKDQMTFATSASSSQTAQNSALDPISKTNDLAQDSAMAAPQISSSLDLDSKAASSHALMANPARQPSVSATLKVDKRSVQAGNRLYIKDPSALQVHVDHGSLQALEVRSHASQKVYPDLEEAVAAEQNATFDVKAKIQTEDHQSSTVSWTVIPIGNPVQSELNTRSGQLNTVFTLSEEGKIVSHVQDKSSQPVLCRGFEPVGNQALTPGETLRMYVNDQPGTYQIRIDGQDIQTKVEQDELGQNYLSVPVRLGSSRLRVMRDGKTVYASDLNCHNPFQSLKAVFPVLGAAAGLILDVRRRRML